MVSKIFAKLMLILVLALGLFLVGCIQNDASQSTAATATPASTSAPRATSAPTLTTGSQDYTITITSTGYQPARLTVPKGSTVTWVNNTDIPNWPASAFHPTHEVYPESGGCISSAFDACKGLGAGESFSFAFNQNGTWGYHNHLNPSQTGKIIVQ